MAAARHQVAGGSPAVGHHPPVGARQFVAVVPGDAVPGRMGRPPQEPQTQPLILLEARHVQVGGRGDDAAGLPPPDGLEPVQVSEVAQLDTPPQRWQRGCVPEPCRTALGSSGAWNEMRHRSKRTPPIVDLVSHSSRVSRCGTKNMRTGGTHGGRIIHAWHQLLVSGSSLTFAGQLAPAAHWPNAITWPGRRSAKPCHTTTSRCASFCWAAGLTGFAPPPSPSLRASSSTAAGNPVAFVRRGNADRWAPSCSLRPK